MLFARSEDTSAFFGLSFGSTWPRSSAHLHKVGRIPPHRTDVGAFLTAEVVGDRRCILVKDAPGLFTDDPKPDPEAEFIAEIEVEKLIAQDLPDLPVEPALLTALSRAKSVRGVFLINGRERGALTAALEGGNPGTRIYQES